MNKIILILSFILLANCCYSQSGWIQQNCGTTVNLNSVHFVNSQTGWCVGSEGIILNTTNAGTNWILHNIGYIKDLKSISFPSDNIGFIAGDSGLIIKTSNGGLNWLDISFQNELLNSVFFVNENIGYTGGVKIYKTINGGNSWDSMNVFAVKKIYFLNDLTGWVSSLSSSVFLNNSRSKIIFDHVYKTTNGGTSWNISYDGMGRIDIINSLYFIDSLNGWIGSPRSLFGNIPTFYRTTNGGTNWLPTASLNSSNVSNSLFFINLKKGWAAQDNGEIGYTSDGGINWGHQTFETNLIYRSIYFTDSLTGWCVGDSGRILKTTTGGILTNFTNTNSEIPTEYKLDQNYPNPFNPVTNLGFGISDLGFVSLKVYDMLGNEVATLVNEKKPAGSYEVEFDASDYPSGIYFYRLEVGGNIIDTKRMVLLK